MDLGDMVTVFCIVSLLLVGFVSIFMPSERYTPNSDTTHTRHLFTKEESDEIHIPHSNISNAEQYNRRFIQQIKEVYIIRNRTDADNISQGGQYV